MFPLRLLVVHYLLVRCSIQIETEDEGAGYGGDQLQNVLDDDFSNVFNDESLSDDIHCPVKCNPNTDKLCLVTNEALGTSIFETFKEGTNYLSITSCGDGVKFGEEGMELTIENKFENPALTSSFYIMYGKVDAEIKGAFGSGIVSSLYLQSDDLDEIDIAEILGGDPFDYQTNYFIKGNVTSYDRERYHKLQVSPLKEYYKYGVEWTPSKIIWYLDDQPVRQLSCKNKQGFPTSPMAIKISLWAGEDTENEGTIAWSKGLTNYQDGPFTMNVRNLMVSDYSSGKTYSYGWLPNGSWLDLVANDGEISTLKSENDVGFDSPVQILTPPQDYTTDFTVPRERHGDWTIPHERVWTPTWSATLTELIDYASITDDNDSQLDDAIDDPIEYAFPTLPVDRGVKNKQVVDRNQAELAPVTKTDSKISELISESWFATTSTMAAEYHFTTLIHNSKMTAKPIAPARPEKAKPEWPKTEKAKPEKAKLDKPNSDKPNSDKPNSDKPNSDKPNSDKPLSEKLEPEKFKPEKFTPTKSTKVTDPSRVSRTTTTSVETEFIQFPEEHRHHQHHHYPHPKQKVGSHEPQVESGVARLLVIPVAAMLLTELLVLVTSL